MHLTHLDLWMHRVVSVELIMRSQSINAVVVSYVVNQYFLKHKISVEN